MTVEASGNASPQRLGSLERKTLQYSVSIIMAVHDSALYIRDAIDSVIAQDIGFHEHIQLILVDDGSSDASPLICDEYAGRFPDNITVIHQANAGAAAARNAGLACARGYYLNFMDSDDLLAPRVVSQVLSFFREHADEIDVVTVPIMQFDDSPARCWDHWQNFKFELGTRVINLETTYEAPLMFTNASFFDARVRDEIHFDERLVVSEDNKVLLTVLADKMAFGVISESDCAYLYRRTQGGLVSQGKFKRSWYIDYLDYLVSWAFEYYQGRFGFVPEFVQYQIMCDLQWRIIEECDPETVLGQHGACEYVDKLSASLRMIDDRHILRQRRFQREHRCFALAMKYGRPAALERGKVVTNDGTDEEEFVDVIDDGTWVTYALAENGPELLLTYGSTIAASVRDQVFELCFLHIRDGRLYIEGDVRTYGISDDVKLDAFVVSNGVEYACALEPYAKETKTRLGRTLVRAYWFAVDLPLDHNANSYDMKFAYRLGGELVFIRRPRMGRFMPVTDRFSESYWWQEGWALSLAADTLHVERCDSKGRRARERAFIRQLLGSDEKGARKAALVRVAHSFRAGRKRKPVWLISDRFTRAGDNGEAFFRWLRENHAGDVDAHFVLSESSADYGCLAGIGPVLEPMSSRHKLLYLESDFVISSQADETYLNPFPGYQYPYADIVSQKRFVFLQHGITKDDISGWLCRRNKNLRGFVTAALPERDSIVDGDYGYTDREVWLTGFPRFDLLEDRSVEQPNRVITVMPTWRKYLMGSADPATAVWTLSSAFATSPYFTTYRALANDAGFLDELERLGCRLQFLPHPTLQPYVGNFEHDPRVRMLGLDASYRDVYAESSLVVTDYSSAVFDFAYLRKPVVYFQFDADEFFSGGHVYTKGYFDYSRDGFGEVETTLRGLEERLLSYARSGFAMAPAYRARADRFFAFDDRGSCERLYERLLSANEEDGR
ncbi:CDP-glycerol glycerophosphotransferase family protein [bacterium]|nr:CDP-glycerol glycerophosphotransferase family protein [bacterium]